MMFNGNFTQEAKIVWVTAPADYNASACTAEYLNMSKYDKVVFIIQTGAWAGGAAAVTLLQADTVAAGNAKALAFTKMYTNDGAPTGDTLTETTVTGNTFNIDTANSLYVIEVDAAQLDVDNSFDCVALAIAAASGDNADFYSVVALAMKGRNMAGLSSPSAIT